MVKADDSFFYLPNARILGLRIMLIRRYVAIALENMRLVCTVSEWHLHFAVSFWFLLDATTEYSPTTCLQCLILVIDSTDRERLSMSKEELYRMLAHDVCPWVACLRLGIGILWHMGICVGETITNSIRAGIH